MFTRFSKLAANALKRDRTHRKETLTGMFNLSGGKLRLMSTALAMAVLPLLSAGATELADSEYSDIGGGFDVPIIVNDGQLPSEVDYAACGPAGNTIYFTDDGSIDLYMRGVEGGAAVSNTLEHVGASPSVTFNAGTQLSSVTDYFGGEGLDLPTGVLNYDKVTVSGIYDQTDAEFSANGRQLIITYNMNGGSTNQDIVLDFNLDTPLEAEKRNYSWKLKASPSSAERWITVHPAQVVVGGSADIVLREFTLDADDNLNLDVDGLADTDDAVITVKITLGPFLLEYDAVNDNNDKVVAVSTAYNSAQIGGELSGDDVIITRLNGDKDQVLSTTVLAGSGSDRAYGVVVVNNGAYIDDIIVSGQTDSDDFPQVGDADGIDGFVMRLNEDANAINGGVKISERDRVAVHDVAIGADGEILYVGVSDNDVQNVGLTGLNFKTVLPEAPAGATMQKYFLGIVDAAASKVNQQVAFEGPTIGARLQVGCTPADGPCAGTPCGDGPEDECNYTSTMDNIITRPCKSGIDWMDPYWGWHALCWKEASSPNHTLDLTFPPPVGSVPPQQVVRAPDAQELNDLEATEFTHTGGGNNNPGGDWYHNRYDDFSTQHSDMIVELALGAAFYHEKWGSPVYANHNNSTNTAADYPFVVQKVTMDIKDENGNDASLFDVCDPENWTAWRGDMYDANCMFAALEQIAWCNFDVIWWDNPMLLDDVYPHDVWDTFKQTPWLSVSGVYIADPPTGEAHQLDNIAEFSRCLKDQVMGLTSVEVTTYTDGAVESSTSEEKLIPMVAFYEEDVPAANVTDVDVKSPAAQFGAIKVGPNPTDGMTKISYTPAQPGDVTLAIYSTTGEIVATLDAGYREHREYTFDFDGSTLATGAYFVRLSVPGGVVSAPLQVIR